MKCDRARELLSEYHENSVDYALSETIRCHLDQCTSCRHEYEAIRNTWSALDALPEIEPPVSFRHDVVMRVVRMQSEQKHAPGQRRWGIDWSSLLPKLAPARTIALACACMALAAVIIKVVPSSTQQYTAGVVRPGIMSTGESAGREPSSRVAAALSGTDEGRKAEWQNRKMLRNSLWITVTPEQSGGEASYLLTLAVNKSALVKAESVTKLPVRIFVIPEGMDVNAAKNGTPALQGDILAGSEPMSVRIKQPTNLLVTWSVLGLDCARIVILPSKSRSVSDDSLGTGMTGSIGSGNDLYVTLESISRDYGVPIIAGAGLKQRSVSVDVGDGSLGEELRRCLQPSNVEWLFADNAVYVDSRYKPIP